jgi:hypothetical protein
MRLRYAKKGERWWRWLQQRVGDNRWAQINEQQQLNLVNERAEYLWAVELRDKVEPDEELACGWEAVISVASLALLVGEGVMAYQQSVKTEVECELVAVGADKVLSLDLTKRLGTKLGANWCATLMNEDKEVVAQAGVKSSHKDHLGGMFAAVGSRGNVTAKVLGRCEWLHEDTTKSVLLQLPWCEGSDERLHARPASASRANE